MSKKKKTTYTKKLITTKLENDSGFDLSKILDESTDAKLEIVKDNNEIEIENLKFNQEKEEANEAKTKVLSPPPVPPVPFELNQDVDKTVPIQVAKQSPKINDNQETKVSYGVKNAPINKFVPTMKNFFGSEKEGELSLRQTENLRLAQERINELEDEIDQLRRENDELASAGETYKQINEKYYHDIENLRREIVDVKESVHNEMLIYKKSNAEKDKKIKEYRQQIEDLNSRIEVNFRKIRKREKELEHRLEIAKIDELAVIKSKDKMILDLKRRMDQVTIESDNFKQKSQQNFEELQKKQHLMRGVVRALRLALTKLEGDIDSSDDDQ